MGILHKAKLRAVNPAISTTPDAKLRKVGNLMTMKPLEPNAMDKYQEQMIKQREGGIKRVPVAVTGGVGGTAYRRAVYQ